MTKITTFAFERKKIWFIVDIAMWLIYSMSIYTEDPKKLVHLPTIVKDPREHAARHGMDSTYDWELTPCIL